MCRAWRIEYKGALYHLMSRGSGGKTRANILDAFLNRLSRGKGRIIITASSASEVSKESRAREKRPGCDRKGKNSRKIKELLKNYKF